MSTFSLSCWRASLYKRRVLATVAALAGAAATTLFSIRYAEACGGSPPPPTCGKSLALVKALPAVVVLPPGGVGVVVPVATTVTLGLTETPPGSGACPPPPFICTVTLTSACIPPPAPPISTVTVPIVPGPNAIVLPLFVPPGPPRVCVITGTATVTFTDGSTITATGDTTLCVVRAAPQDPQLPEVELEVLGDEQQRVHPGVTAWYPISIKNNHPTLGISATLTCNSINSARQPTSSGDPAGTGPYSFSDPDPKRMTDNFDVGYWDETSGCIPSRPDPHQPLIPTVTKIINLGPGESTVEHLGVKPSGMCSDGSCSEGRATVDYFRSDGLPGVACVGLTTIVDTNMAPVYECGDSGAATTFQPLAAGRLLLLGRPRASELYQIPIELVQLQLQGIPVTGNTSANLLRNNMRPTSDYARQQTLISGGPPIPVGSFFDVFYTVQLQPSGSLNFFVQNWQFMPGAPTGISDVAPMAMGQLQVNNLAAGSQSILDFVQQVNVTALDNLGRQHRMIIDNVQTFFGSSQISIRLFGSTAPAPGGGQIIALDMENDWRAYAHTASGLQFGACCLPYGDCQIRTPSACNAKGGQYLGDGSACFSGACGTPELDFELLSLEVCNISATEAEITADVGIYGAPPSGISVEALATVATGTSVGTEAHLLVLDGTGITCNIGGAPPCAGACPATTATFKNETYDVPAGTCESIAIPPFNPVCGCKYVITLKKRLNLPSGSAEPHSITFALDAGNARAEVDEANNRRMVVHQSSTPTCVSGLIGDMNCDGFVSVGDIAGFVLALTNPAAYAATYPDCDINNGDINGDGFISVGDIGQFVSLLTGG